MITLKRKKAIKHPTSFYKLLVFLNAVSAFSLVVVRLKVVRIIIWPSWPIYISTEVEILFCWGVCEMDTMEEDNGTGDTGESSTTSSKQSAEEKNPLPKIMPSFHQIQGQRNGKLLHLLQWFHRIGQPSCKPYSGEKCYPWPSTWNQGVYSLEGLPLTPGVCCCNLGNRVVQNVERNGERCWKTANGERGGHEGSRLGTWWPCSFQRLERDFDKLKKLKSVVMYGDSVTDSCMSVYKPLFELTVTFDSQKGR